MQTAAVRASAMARRWSRRPGRGASARERIAASSASPEARPGAKSAAAPAGSTAGSPGRAAAPMVSPRCAGSMATRITPTAARTTPASWATAGRSPAAIPTAKGMSALVALIGATMLMVPMASAL